MRELHLVFYGRLPGMNEIIHAARTNVYASNKMKQGAQDELRAQWAFEIKEPQPFTVPVNVAVTFYEKDNRRDDDNVFAGLKFILDALQDAGLIVKDSPKWCHVTAERFTDPAQPRIEIIITERKRGNE